MKMQANVSFVPVYKQASEESPLLTQILYGETYEILSDHGKFLKIKADFDGTEGFVDAKVLVSADLQNREILKQPFLYYSTATERHLLSAGSEIIPNGKDLSETLLKISDYARQFLNVPEVRGGRSFFGTDSAGFVQMVFKVFGFKLPRFAIEQSELGIVLDFINEVQAGDLAFFEDEESQINHVGMLLDTGEVIHAYGKVRIDLLDSAGIYNRELKKHTHKLRFIKTFTSFK